MSNGGKVSIFVRVVVYEPVCQPGDGAGRSDLVHLAESSEECGADEPLQVLLVGARLVGVDAPMDLSVCLSVKDVRKNHFDLVFSRVRRIAACKLSIYSFCQY